jgi:hypothetical protein
VDVEATCRAVTNARVYFERIDLHPLAVALSFVQTVADKRVGFGAFPFGCSFSFFLGGNGGFIHHMAINGT